MQKIIWIFYTTTNAFFTLSQVNPINKHQFDKAAPNKILETLVVYIVAVEAIILMYLFSGYSDSYIAIRHKISSEYLDYADIFSSDMAMELKNNTSINKHAIRLIKQNQSVCRPIYALSSIEWETWKIHIKTYLKTGLTNLQKSLLKRSFFSKKNLIVACANAFIIKVEITSKA